MPRGFTEWERERIRVALLEKGGEFLAGYGVRKTSVEDLTRAVGISKGAFYAFFDSKEELFFEVLGLFEDEYHAEMLRGAVQEGVTPERQVRDFLRGAFSVWRANPLFASFDQAEYEHLVRKLPEEKVRANLDKDQVFIGRLLELWRENGVEIDCKPDVFLGLMRSLFFISLHEEDLGEGVYPVVIELFTDLISERIVRG